MVTFAMSMNMRLVKRDEDRVVIENANSDEETFDILACFPFSSETKRMGILVRHLATKKIIYYLKGADTIMVSRVRKFYRSYVTDDCDNLARDGLRTLVIAQKSISEEFYAKWETTFKKA